MAELAQKHQDQLKPIKKNISKAFKYFKRNCERFHDYQKFVFKTAISASDESSLNAAGKPIIEFNITNAPISRLCGEFSKQEPSIYVSAENGTEVDEKTMEVVEGHLRHILFESKKHNTQYNVYRDQLSGGFSDFKVWTDYANEMSFDQVIKFGRTFEPTMTGFDPMAREIDKSDAEYCFELFPMSKETFSHKYPDIDISELKFVRMEEEGFNWTYKTDEEDVIVLVDYYTRKKRKKKIVRLANNQVMTMEEYEKNIEEWNKQGFIEQPPAIVGEPRWTELNYVVRYRLMDCHMLEYDETSFKYLPLVYVDGDSVMIKDGDSSTMQQFTKPYVYHAMGIQKLTNFAGQVIANDFENMVMHKFMVAEEALPTQKEYLEAYSNVQQASTLVYKSLYDENPEHPLPAPQPIQRVPLPQEVLTTFNTSMQMLQNILGAYDASLGINDNQLSGVAIVEGATQSNASAMPYIVNYMQSLSQVANIIIDLIPKYYKTPRTIPIIDKEGRRSVQKINQPGGVTFNYDENALQVKVEAGVNFQIAKNQALNQITMLMKVSPLFSEYMSTVGLETLLDNVEFRNVDIVKGKVQQWLQEKQKAAQQQPNPEMIKAQLMQQQVQIAQQQVQNESQKTQLKSEEVAGKAMLDTERLILEKEKVDNERLEIVAKMGESKVNLLTGLAKARAEEKRAAVDLRLKADHQSHTQFKELAETAIKHHIATQEKESKE